MLGAVVALAGAYAIRIVIYSSTFTDNLTMVPDQNPYYPFILEHTKGMPAYGQIFVAEMLGTCFFTLVYLVLKYEISKKKVDPISAALACAAAYYAMTETFKNVSNGALNPALHVA